MIESRELSSTQDHQNRKDDFRQIRGIGPAIEARLNAAGIFRYEQLAELNAHDLAQILSGLTGITPEAVQRKDWIGQARQLAAEQQEEEIPVEPPEAGSHLHYAVFTVELLMDEQQQVRRTRVMHVQTQQETAWAGWDGDRLMENITKRAGIPDPAVPVREEEPVVMSETVPPPSSEPEIAGPAAGSESFLSGSLQIAGMQFRSDRESTERKMLMSGQPFSAIVDLDLKQVLSPQFLSCSCTGQVFAHRLSDGARFEIGKDQVRLEPDHPSIEIPCQPLDHGVYRLESFVTLSLPGAAGPGAQRMAMLEGPPLQVF